MPALKQTYATAFPDLALSAKPDIPQGTRAVWVNEPLAAELGLDATWLSSPEGLKWLTGGSGTSTYALAYSGFQFGQLSPVLGDGRAHLIGEILDETGKPRADVHLKGSGKTPFSRPGSDGKAPLSAVWREAVIGEALAAYGVPSSRALAVLETGERIRRRSPMPEPAGILVRVADSHIRVGTFQFAAMQCEPEVRSDLVDYALKRHYPQLVGVQNPAMALLGAVVESQAQLTAQWAGLGFVHGVLNTDNVAISGASIDFGPCAFIDEFRRDAVYSSIDRQGRYRFSNQPAVTRWNLTRFAEVLLDLIDEDPNRAVERAGFVLEGFEDLYQDALARVFAAKLGIDVGSVAGSNLGELLDEIYALTEQALSLLEDNSFDFTGFFRTLTEAPDALGAQMKDATAWASWREELARLREQTATSAHRAGELMEATNPVYIPRNLALDEALRSVERGDREPVERILAAVRQPWLQRPEYADLETAPAQSRFFTSFCGT